MCSACRVLSDAMSDTSKPLDGILVVSLEQAVAAPTCSARLADAGARVIKVERKEGDFARGYDSYVKGEATYFVWANRGKESICLDLKAEDDRAVLERLLAQADVFIQNLSVGAAERLDLGATALHQRYPRLITCSISGYGEDGPYRHMRAYDMLLQAESGFSSISGDGRAGVSIADIITGINAHGAVLEALFQRQQTGEGSHISLSLFDSMTDLMAVPLLQTRYSGEPPRYIGMRHPAIVPYGNFPTANGGEVVFSVQNEREWARLCAQILERPDLITDPRTCDNKVRTANREFVEDIVTAVTRNRSQGCVTEQLLKAGIAHGRFNHLPEVLDHPQLRDCSVPLPSGEVAEVPAPPARVPWRNDALGAVPGLGEQSAAIRAEFARENDGE